MCPILQVLATDPKELEAIRQVATIASYDIK
jgi:hypothetical protein